MLLVSETLTFFRKQPFQIRLPFRSCGETPSPRVSASTGSVYRICVARRRVCGRETGSSGGGARSRATGGRSSGNSRRRRRRPMLGRYVGVVRPCCAVSCDGGRWIGVGRVRSRCLCVCCWGVSVGVGARLAGVVVRHGARRPTPSASRDHFFATPLQRRPNGALHRDKKANLGQKKGLEFVR